MKINIITKTILLLMLSATNVKAQAFEQGRSIISAGYGFGNFTQALFKSYESESNYKYKGTGPLFFKYEFGISEKIGLGLNFAYISSTASFEDPTYLVNGNDIYKETVKFSSLSILPRLNFHLSESDRFDPYVGFGIGYRTGKWTYENNDPDYPEKAEGKTLIPFGMDLTIGARYYFTPNIGAYAEAGIAKGIIQFGLSCKL